MDGSGRRGHPPAGAGAAVQHGTGERGAETVTLADVARLAGVSLATASRALSGRGPVAPATRQRVVTAARRLDFQPSSVARSLRTERTRVIGFVVPDVSSGFYANALKGAQHRLATMGYAVALLDTDEEPDRELEALRALARQRVDGVILCSSGAPAEELRRLIARLGVPVVFFDNVVPGLGKGSVVLANETGVRLLVDHLAQVHRHRRIGFVSGLVSETSGAERLAGFRLGLGANGLPVSDAYVRQGDWSHDAGWRETLALLALPQPPTAIVYADAAMALGGLAALRHLGRRVPQEVALVSFDDWEAGALLDPPLTALGQRDRLVGDLAASLLLRALEDPTAESVDVRVPVELTIRRSCGCPPAVAGEVAAKPMRAEG
jgi:LacI family transcriptional regulator